MSNVFGIVLILAGVSQMMFMERIVQANASGNQILVGRTSNIHGPRYQRTVIIVISALFIGYGLAFADGAIGHS